MPKPTDNQIDWDGTVNFSDANGNPSDLLGIKSILFTDAGEAPSTNDKKLQRHGTTLKFGGSSVVSLLNMTTGKIMGAGIEDTQLVKGSGISGTGAITTIAVSSGVAGALSDGVLTLSGDLTKVILSTNEAMSSGTNNTALYTGATAPVGTALLNYNSGTGYYTFYIKFASNNWISLAGTDPSFNGTAGVANSTFS